MSTADHARYEELVVGLALSALEPADEQELLRHLPACAACERDLAVHQATLSHLAYAGEAVTPPASLWEGIRREVMAQSATAFAELDLADRPGERPVVVAEPPAAAAGVAPVTDLQAVRQRRAGRRRLATWTAGVAAAAVVAVLGVVGVTALRDDEPGVSGTLAAAVRALQTSPARTVPLRGQDGVPVTVAVLRADSVSLVLQGLPGNDTSTSTYVLWGIGGGSSSPVAFATFDSTGDQLQVVSDLPLPAGAQAAPNALAITREAGRVAPAGPRTPILAQGRAA